MDHHSCFHLPPLRPGRLMSWGRQEARSAAGAAAACCSDRFQRSRIRERPHLLAPLPVHAFSVWRWTAGGGERGAGGEERARTGVGGSAKQGEESEGGRGREGGGKRGAPWRFMVDNNSRLWKLPMVQAISARTFAKSSHWQPQAIQAHQPAMTSAL